MCVCVRVCVLLLPHTFFCLIVLYLNKKDILFKIYLQIFKQ